MLNFNLGILSLSFVLSSNSSAETPHGKSQSINPVAPEGNQSAIRKEEKEKGTRRLNKNKNQLPTTDHRNEFAPF